MSWTLFSQIIMLSTWGAILATYIVNNVRDHKSVDDAVRKQAGLS